MVLINMLAIFPKPLILPGRSLHKIKGLRIENKLKPGIFDAVRLW